MDAVGVARALVAEQFPGARTALLTGSGAHGGFTATSDLDLVVVLDGAPASYRETFRYRGVPVELLVLTEESIRERWEREAVERRNSLADMCAHGVVLVGPAAGERIRRAAVAFLAAGPPALTGAELDKRRYRLTSALDDLGDIADPDERDAVAGRVLLSVGELALFSRGHWLGRGKWLPRRLRALDRELADRLFAAHRRAVSTGETSELIAVADSVLAGVGGRLFEGYRAP